MRLPTERGTGAGAARTKLPSLEGQRISTAQDYETRYWAHKFGVTAEQLQRAIRQVGNAAEDVRRHLGK